MQSHSNLAKRTPKIKQVDDQDIQGIYFLTFQTTTLTL